MIDGIKQLVSKFVSNGVPEIALVGTISSLDGGDRSLIEPAVVVLSGILGPEERAGVRVGPLVGGVGVGKVGELGAEQLGEVGLVLGELVVEAEDGGERGRVEEERELGAVADVAKTLGVV